MRTIIVLLDSLNRHFLSVYGNDWVQTPSIEQFAQQSVVFDQHWLGSAPCMPARRDMLTGHLNFPWRGWGGLEPYDVTLPQLLRKAGVFTHMVTDHYHYFEIGGENYHAVFDTWDLQRGQESDPWVSRVKQPSVPDRYYGTFRPQYQLNRGLYQVAENYPSPRTFQSAIDWLEANKEADNYLLWVEGFDPHEPFDAPSDYLQLYNDDYTGIPFEWSTANSVTEPPQAIEHLRKRYAAVLSMSDHWFGKLLQTLQAAGHYEDSLIIVTTDHGHLLGEHNFTGKSVMPAYNELANIPLNVHLPGGVHAGRRVKKLTQNIDLMPTVLDYHNVARPEGLHGYSWRLLLEDKEVEWPRNAALYGWFGQSFNITDGEYTYFRVPTGDNKPLYNYGLMPTSFRHYWPTASLKQAILGDFIPYSATPVLQVPAVTKRSPFNNENLLFNIKNDPSQQHPLTNSQLEQRMIALLRSEMDRLQVPTEHIVRLGMKTSP